MTSKTFLHFLSRSHCQPARRLIRLSAIKRVTMNLFCAGEDAGAARAALVSFAMQRQLTAFVEQPCQATYVAARDAVLKRSPLAMAATDFAELEWLLSQEAFQVLLDRLD